MQASLTPVLGEFSRLDGSCSAGPPHAAAQTHCPARWPPGSIASCRPSRSARRARRDRLPPAGPTAGARAQAFLWAVGHAEAGRGRVKPCPGAAVAGRPSGGSHRGPRRLLARRLGGGPARTACAATPDTTEPRSGGVKLREIDESLTLSRFLLHSRRHAMSWAKGIRRRCHVRPAWLRPKGFVLGIALLTSACAATTVPRLADARGAPDSFAPLVKKVLPAVVNIAVTETVSGGDMAAQLPPELRDTPFGREFRRRSAASASRCWAPAPASSSIRPASSSPTTTWSDTPARSSSR